VEGSSFDLTGGTLLEFSGGTAENHDNLGWDRRFPRQDLNPQGVLMFKKTSRNFTFMAI